MSDHKDMREHVGHYHACTKAPIGCPKCVEAQTAIMEGVVDLLLDLDDTRTELGANRRDLSEMRIELSSAVRGDDGEQALANWALDYGAELAVLKASPRTYEVARLALQERGGPACDNYEIKGTFDLCKCGRPLREHRRELVTA